MQRILLALFSLCTLAMAQDPAADVAAALLRGDLVTAARAVASVTSPAARARLQAAMLPLQQRPAAMLAVAAAFPGDREADQALLAGAAAAVAVLDCHDAVAGLAAWTEVEDDTQWRSADFDALAHVVVGLREAVAARTKAGGQATTLGEAQRLLELACVSRFGLWPARVAQGATWDRPKDLAEDLRLRAFRCAPGHVGWAQLDALGPPAWEARLPQAGELAIPALSPGNWLLEARSTSSPWRGVRVLEVSDLDAVALVDDGVLVLAASDRAGLAAAGWQLRVGSADLARGELGATPAVIALPPVGEHESSPRELLLQGPAGTAWLELPRAREARDPTTRWLAHVMVDRPLYRPGETVQGRVVLRSCRWEGKGLAAVPFTEQAREQPFVLIASAGKTFEVRLPGRTDERGVFPFSFVIPNDAEPGDWLDCNVHMPSADADDPTSRLWMHHLCGVANFRRQAVRLRVAGPETVPEGADTVEIAACVEWASGGPAAGLAVQATVSAWSEHAREEVHALRTGADGRAVLRIPCAHLAGHWVRARFQVTGPDGRQLEGWHQLRVPSPADAKQEETAPEPWWRSPTGPALELGAAIVGTTCPVTLRGEPNQRALLVVGRGATARAQTVQLDGQGQASVAVPVLRLDWPELDVAAATALGVSHAQASVALRAQPKVTFDVPALAAPGSDVVCRLTTGVAGTVVTVAVVDERIFEMQEDCMGDPDAALRPYLRNGEWEHVATPKAQGLGELLGSVLRDGRLPPIDEFMRDLSRRGRAAGGSGGPAGGGPGGLRAQFRATAAFLTVVAGADGIADVRFRMPDDLTRWRLTAVGVAPDGVGFVERRTLASRQPLAAEPLLPRAVRAGDAFELPISVDRSADAAASANAVAVTAAVMGDALQLARASSACEVEKGSVVRTSLALRAVQPGDATLSLAAELGAHADRSQHVVSVGRDAVVRPLMAAALGEGEVTVPMPAGSDAEGGVVVDVLQGGAAAWRQLERDLAAYPYGCVEQTLSRLVPYFAVARSAKERGEPLPAMDAGFQKRLRAGLSRLRELRDHGGGFAFWPGGEFEPRMTALVLHGLAVLREGGYDPAAAGLECDAWRSRFRDALERVQGRKVVVDADFVTAAELTAAVLRFLPKDARAMTAAARVLDVLPELPAGLCARLGLALNAAGDLAGARRCRTRLAAMPAKELGADGFPGEDPLAVQALQLELDCVLQTEAAIRERGTADLLLACLNGRGSTYAHASALAALARVLPPAKDVEATIEVRVGDVRREFALGGKHGDAVRWRVPRAAAVSVRGPDGLPLLVRIRSERSERASDHPAWATPIRVEREFCTVRADATTEQSERGEDLVPCVGPLPVGQPVTLRLRVTAATAMRYVVVDCPLPLGFELAREPAHVDRFDDRVAFACDLAAGVPCVRTLVVVPTVPGRLVLPPAVAMPMYVSGCEGGSAGGFVEVRVSPADATGSSVVCFRAPLQPLLPAESDPAEDFASALCDAWDLDPPDEPQSRAAAEKLLANVPSLPGGGAVLPWLESYTELLGDLALTAAVRDRRGAEWRVGVLDRVRGLQRRATIEALAHFEAAPPDWREGADMYRLAAALEAWTDRPSAEPLLARLIARTRREAPGWLHGLFRTTEPPATAPALRAELRLCLGVANADVRQAAFDWLPRQDREQLPPVLVIAAQKGAFGDGIVELLASSEAGLGELRVRLRDPDFVVDQLRAIVRELPAALWCSVQLSSFAAMAEVLDDDDLLAPPELAAHVAAAPFADTELQQAMAATRVPAWRAVLATALRQRGVKTTAAAVRAADEYWPFWSRALALGKDDANAAVILLEELEQRGAHERFAAELDLLAQFVLAPLVAVGGPSQVHRARVWMTRPSWQAVWARLHSADRIALMDRFRRSIGDEFVPATAAEAEAVWRFLLRSGNVEDAVDTLTSSDAGVVCLRRHLAAGDGGAHEKAIRAQFAKRLEVDPDTLAPFPGRPWLPLVRRLQRCGFAGEWTQPEAQLLEQLRAQRGVGRLGR